MFKRKTADRLDEELVTTTIGKNEEEFQLRPMDPMTRPTFKEAIDTIALMKTPEDWYNIIPFTTGLLMSNRIVKSDRWEWIIRKAAEAHSLGTIYECAKQGERTGLHFSNFGVVRRYFFELHRLAQNNDFKGPAVEKALRLARQSVDLMHEAPHRVLDPKQDPMAKPFTIGVLLELSAARAHDAFGGKDEDGLVATYAHRLSGVKSPGKIDVKDSDWVTKDIILQENLPIYNGMKLFLRVKGIPHPIRQGLEKRLNPMRSSLQKLVDSAPKEVKNKPTIGLQQSSLLK